MASHKPKRLTGRHYERIWGSTNLEPWFPNVSGKIGEVWYAEEDSPVLIKFLFTTENLSVQVHPNDEQARAHGGSRGKTEMWHILRAEPGARIALGLQQPATPEELRQACLDGSVMDLLRWIPVSGGETWFVPAGAIHAIGAGITLCEIQQNSDITYRMFDYGRARELHLDRGIAVTDAGFDAGAGAAVAPVECPHFRAETVSLAGALNLPHAGEYGVRLLAIMEGEGAMAGEPFQMGEVWALPPGVPVEITGNAKLMHVTA